jgi:hypothetical protein
VLVLCEQGLGDTIQFVRYAPLLAERGANVIIECQARLKPLLKGMERGDAETRPSALRLRLEEGRGDRRSRATRRRGLRL